MRLWSIHPRFLDPQGLVALWREGLLAQKVLLGETKGFRNHPQLYRFRKTTAPVATMGAYLIEVVTEASRRGYRFDDTKIIKVNEAARLPVTAGQIAYEWDHLQAKLKARSPMVYERNLVVEFPDVHPIFTVIAGEVEAWERRT